MKNKLFNLKLWTNNLREKIVINNFIIFLFQEKNYLHINQIAKNNNKLLKKRPHLTV